MTALGLSEGGEDRPDRSARPPVHYQISVTGRQAGFFFLLLLAALALAFFFGMRTGAAARKGPGAVATLVSASDLPVPTLAPAEGSREGHAAASQAEKLAEDTLGFSPEKRAALRDAVVPTPAPAATPAPSSSSPVVSAAALAAPKEAAPKEAAPKKVALPKEAPQAKGSSGASKTKGPFYVQVLATKKAPAADEIRKRLKDEGFAADVSAVPGKDGWFRVRVGPFKERAKAEATARKIKTTDKQIRNTPLVVP